MFILGSVSSLLTFYSHRIPQEFHPCSIWELREEFVPFHKGTGIQSTLFLLLLLLSAISSLLLGLQLASQKKELFAKPPSRSHLEMSTSRRKSQNSSRDHWLSGTTEDAIWSTTSLYNHQTKVLLSQYGTCVWFFLKKKIDCTSEQSGMNRFIGDRIKREELIFRA